MKGITLLLTSSIITSALPSLWADVTPAYQLDLSGSAGSDGSYGSTDDPGTSGTSGTNGGDATFKTSEIQSELPQNLPITIISDGGVGGNGNRDAKDGSGGNGGNLDITIDTALDQEIVLRPAVTLSASGGDTGGGNFSDGYAMENITPITTVGGNGGYLALTIAENGSLQFAGPLTAGISMQADGGDGGHGASKNSHFWEDNDYPGTGDIGGNGGDAHLTINGSLTGENLSPSVTGVTISASGGDGGNGGDDTAEGTGVAGDSAPAGSGGKVTVDIGKKAIVKLSSDGVPAIIAQANGGSAGSAGSGETGTWGSAGGNGGSVSFTNSGHISTDGDVAPTVTLESIGGDGGDGSGGSSNDYGGIGGNGGDITFTNEGSISTTGDHSFGVVLQSVGGTGGSGGDGIFHGGDGGQSAKAGTVTITGSTTGITGSISTQGDNAIGIIAQSIGGGNASGALQVANNAAQDSGSGASGGSPSGWFFSQGGDGGTGGDGSKVSIQNNNAITTGGSNAPAILAQSLGGGGGQGGDDQTSGIIVTVGDAGSGSQGGKGGDVTISDVINADKKQFYQAPIVTSGVSSSGIEAFSIGGSGGMGGAASTNDYTLGLGVNIGKGGAGGDGNNAGSVTIDYHSDITTESSDSSGIVAVSIGGGGGKGGQASALSSVLSLPDVPSASATIGIGGDGGGGASGGKVQVDTHGMIVTNGMQSRGIYASSIGGGGGMGGNALTQTNTYGGGKQANVGVSIGGNGGDGGTGGEVDAHVHTDSVIITNGFASDGIHAVSVGGGGGDGGTGSSSTTTPSIKLEFAGDIQYLSLSNSTNIDTNISIGGSGGSGNHGGKVNATNDGTIITGASDSRGILAYSIGGGGGAGASGASSSAQNINIGFNIGGSGGSGSHGDAVTVSNTKNANIITNGDGSHGIHALSVGGGGGVGGTQTADADFEELHEFVQDKIEGYVGEKFGFGKDISKIKDLLNNKLKDSAPGVADDLKDYLNSEDDEEGDDGMPSMSFNVGIGGSGGAGGDGGTVTVTNEGNIETFGDAAFGIFAHSIGGGGGAGGIAGQDGTTFEKDLSAADPFDNNFGVGGTDGAQGDGAAVTVTHAGEITTHGHSSFGILAQSIGGGGGVAVFSTTDSTFGLDISGQLGSAGTNGSHSQSDIVTVNVNKSSSIETYGSESHGVVAQSIGGGGGLFLVNPSDSDGSSGVATDPNFVTQIETILTDNGVDLNDLKNDYINSLNNATGTIALQLGSDWSNNGDGGDLIINHDGAITTHGDNAFGILAQSIGGGGGLGSDGVGTNTQQTVTGYFGAGYGNAGYLTINLGNRASIQTSGKGAVGIFAQAIGGGGGYTGAFEGAVDSLREFLAAAPEGGSSGNASTGNLSIVMADENAHSVQIKTTGDYAHGIYTQNLANGGGAVGSAGGITIHDFNGHSYRGSNTQGGSTGNTIIDLVGTISATGYQAVGIFAQNGILASEGTVFSDFSDSYGSIELTHKGSITGGDGHDAAGIWLDGGNDSNSINYSHGTLSAKSGTAISLSNTGQTTINNNLLGVIIGNIRTNDSSSAITFNNNQHASYQPGDSIDLNGGVFNNAGIFDIAGPGVIGKSTLNGSFTQTQTGVWNLDLNGRTSENDMLTVSGGSTSLAQGKIKPNFVKDGLPTDLSTLNGSEFTILKSGLLEDINTEGIQITQSSMVNFSIVQDNGILSDVRLKANVDPHKALKDLGDSRPNVGASANYLNALINTSGAHSTQASTGETGEHITHLLNINSSGEYQKALQDLSPEVHTATQASAAHSASSFQKSLHSIPVFVGDTAQLSEASGAYARTTYTNLEHSNSQQISGYDQDDTVFHFGGQQELHDRWYLGGGLNFTSRNVTATNVPSSGNGDYYAGGAVVKKILDENWLLSGSMGFTYGEMDYSRVVNSGGTLRTATSTQKNYIYSGRLRGAYNFDMGMWYIRPGSNIDLMHMNIPAYTESGGGALNMHFNESNLTQVGLNPEVEIGGRINIDDSVLRPYGRFGAEWWSNSNHTITSRLASTPAGSPTLTTSYEGDDWVGNVEIGIDLIKADAAEFRLQYNLDFGQNFLANSVSFRAGLLF
ncbi:autotransporter outer membrane beta-barrel domain-containing protein [Cerasicoccus fimbriatus]|uniref:autotransporter outer membrane beta-barrel domain-containing protein n=1 Tax=Cerasicoccus fimbriatus TaxID=3014554 RepID=UPI0022B3C104|nr:autotransporter outer membrane beta-barrel domain-containing protein [Cerasicoccus sp. TK19100]